MQLSHFLVSTTLTAAMLSGGAAVVSTPGDSANNPTTASTVPATDAAAVHRLSVQEATTAVTKRIFLDNPDMSPTAKFPLREITTPEVWNRLHAQVFVITADVRMDQAYIICNGKMAPLGDGFGGAGVMSMCVADLAGDGKLQLIFTYSWGSGRHRSLIAMWTGGPTWVDAKMELPDGDLVVEKVDDQHVAVTFHDYSSDRSDIRSGDFGQVHLSNDKRGLDVELSSKLPDDIADAAKTWSGLKAAPSN